MSVSLRRPRRSFVRFSSLAVIALLVAGLPIETLGFPGQEGPARADATAPAATATTSSPCKYRPSRSTSGARGTLRDRSVTQLGSGKTLTNARVPSLEITGSGVTVKNVHVDGTVLIVGDDVRLRRVTARGIFVSSASNVTVARSKVESSLDTDAFHVTSDRGALVRNVRLRYNFVGRPVSPSDNHFDGVQVRGVDGMEISCSTFRAGPFHENFNAAIFLENANGGTANVTVRDNWLFGFAFSTMVDSPSSAFLDNEIGGDIKWGPCLMLDSAGGGFESSGNTWAETGKKVSLCKQG